MTKKLVVPVDPRDGIKDELIAVSKRHGNLPIADIAHAILLFNRGRFDQIVERMNVQPLLVGTPPASATGT